MSPVSATHVEQEDRKMTEASVSGVRRPDPPDVSRLMSHWASFRCVNDRIAELGLPMEDGAEPLWLVCECPELECVTTMLMARSEYDALRGQEELYAVVPGHEDRRAGEIVGRTDGYVLVRPFTAPAQSGPMGSW
jgi:hypothetical protein